ncbi:MAG TPA: hypothetical protein VNO30_11465 [Kofleriaceae bacterium]|nr:hypothetical protein [Kofleriaceae bacterium]
MRSLCLACLVTCLAACDPDGNPAGMDAPDAPTSEWIVVEELSVPVSSAGVNSVRELTAGVAYRLRATGTYTAALDTLGDAEYTGFNSGKPEDTLGNVDVGLAVNDTIVDGTRAIKWGPYTETHVYEIDFVGTGVPIIAQLHDTTYANNVGSLTLTILKRR